MSGVQFYRDEDLPFFELKLCDALSKLSYKKHAHEEYSLGIVDTGGSSFWCEGKLTEVYQKTLVFIPPDMVHACNPRSDNPWKYKMLFLHANWVKGFIEREGGCTVNYPIVKGVSNHKSFNMVNRMVINLTSPMSPLEKEANILALLKQAVWDGKLAENTHRKSAQPQLNVIKDYLHSRFLEKITLDQLEQVSGLNKFYIIRSFKEVFSIPPHTYQTMLRINYAKKQLRKHRSIVEVAHEAGFYDQSHFYKVFKSHIGVSPESYQKLI